MIADLVGKGGHVRTVPIPGWVKASLDAWTNAAGLTRGRAFRAINKAGRVWGDGMSPKVIWDVVRAAAAHAGIEKLAPHDLRRTCARSVPLGGRRTGPDPDSCWATSRSRRLSATLDASSDSDARSTTPWALNPKTERDLAATEGARQRRWSAPSRRAGS